MDIHPPEHPILSFKEFLVHIGTVTIGILIALSLEGLLESNHHRHLIREARENIRAELEDNQREISTHLAATPKVRQGQETALQWISEVEKHRKSSINSLFISFNRVELNNTSWTTAQAVGALALMDYAEVKKDAAVYELQSEFLRVQTKAQDATVSALGFFSASQDHPENAPPSELELERARLEDSLAAILAQEQIGEALQKGYEVRLKEKQ